LFPRRAGGVGAGRFGLNLADLLPDLPHLFLAHYSASVSGAGYEMRPS